MKKQQKTLWLGLGCLSVLVVLSLIPFSCSYMNQRQIDEVHTRAKGLAVGQTKAQVRAVMGEPHQIIQKSSGILGGPERWLYGGFLEMGDRWKDEFPYYFPFKVRIFSGGDDDFELSFDDKGALKKIRPPKN